MALKTFCKPKRTAIAFFLAMVHMLTGIIHGADDCRTLLFDHPMVGRSLLNHTITSHVTDSRDDNCDLKCYLEDDCMSINFGPGTDGKYYCELSDSDHNLHPEDLQNRDGFIYRPVENFCASNPCSTNGRCQTGFTDKGYRCVCSAGFTGEDCSIEIVGKVQEKPRNSCKNILDSGSSTSDGEYWIDPENSARPLKVYCDMTTDGGGWLLVSNIVFDSSPPQPIPERSYRGIEKYKNYRMVLTKNAMKELSTHLKFTQLRFHCSKQQGRTFHVTTSNNTLGEAVVQYFSGQTDDLPSSCNSFEVMEDDNSQLTMQCDRWGNDRKQYVGKWGHYSNGNGGDRLYNHVAFVANAYHWHIMPSGRKKRWLCDDNEKKLKQGDFWKIYVR